MQTKRAFEAAALLPGKLCVAFLAAFVLAACSPGSGKDPSAMGVQNRGANKDRWWDALPRPEWAAFRRIDVAQQWFEVYAVAEGVYAIYEPGQFEEVVSFLVTGTDRALLFDTGLGIGDMRRVVSELTALDVTVLNSHTHYDHIGGNHQFDTIYAANTDYTRERAHGLPHEAIAEGVSEGWIWKALPPGFDPAAYRTRPFTISRQVVDGEVIDLGGRSLEVLMTPGHAPDSLCLLDRENRMLFTGDTFYLASLYTHLEGSDFDAYALTAMRLAGLEPLVDHVFTAHNLPRTDSRYLGQLAAAFATIAAGGGTYVPTDGNREYMFDGFSIIVAGESGR